jgi:TolB protein
MAIDRTTGSQSASPALAATSGPAVGLTSSRIAFMAAQRKGDDDVSVINVDGSGLPNLTRTPGRDGHPAWSSDGRTIGFVSNRGGNRDLYLMSADGRGQRNLTRELDQPTFGIAWARAQK